MKRIAAVIIIILFLVPFFYHFFRYFKENINQRKEVVSGQQQFVEGVSKAPVIFVRLKNSEEVIDPEDSTEELNKAFEEKVPNITEKIVEKVKPKKQKYESSVQDEILYYRLNSKEHIKQIQVSLKKAGFYKGEIDGKMGSRTKFAIKRFQKAKKLNPDGVVGPKTWEALERYLKN
ncbi:MAG: peptidoglycan-binding protein [Candidatus Omnitrophica bacterium]|nr:peptidoglycan-binding protein [Candidatus Omnitrophota bacterium]MCG2713477.1 peptidoglycan-binding protein [Candidatus Omnitrophota bacterium]